MTVPGPRYEALTFSANAHDLRDPISRPAPQASVLAGTGRGAAAYTTRVFLVARCERAARGGEVTVTFTAPPGWPPGAGAEPHPLLASAITAAAAIAQRPVLVAVWRA